jgi:hypothetical protein
MKGDHNEMVKGELQRSKPLGESFRPGRPVGAAAPLAAPLCGQAVECRLGVRNGGEQWN